MAKPKKVISKKRLAAVKLTAYVKKDQRWKKVWIKDYNKSIHDQAYNQPNGAKLIAKRGNILKHHFAFKNKDESNSNYDPWYAAKKVEGGKTEWHSTWQSLSNPNKVEITMTQDGVKHIADMISKQDKVIEFQHSPLSQEEIQAREDFYQDMIWVMDARSNFNIKLGTGKIVNNVHSFVAVKFESCDWWGYTTKPVYLDIGDGLIKVLLMTNRFMIGIFLQYKHFINSHIDDSGVVIGANSKYYNLNINYLYSLNNHSIKFADNKFSVYGNNYNRRQVFKDNGFRYDGQTKSWWIKCRTANPAYVRPDPLNM